MLEPLQKPLALVVDDDLAYRIYMQQFLELAGFEVIAESNGRLALRRLEQESVAVLVTDLVMPELEGLELIQITKRASPATRIVAVSSGGANGDGGYLRVAALTGAHATLEKPFTGGALIAAAAPDGVPALARAYGTRAISFAPSGS